LYSSIQVSHEILIDFSRKIVIAHYRKRCNDIFKDMSHFTLKLCETAHAITIDIMDEQNSIQLNTLNNEMLCLTWIWDGAKDRVEEKQKLMEEIYSDLLFVEETFGDEMAGNILQLLYGKIDTVYAG